MSAARQEDNGKVGRDILAAYPGWVDEPYESGRVNPFSRAGDYRVNPVRRLKTLAESAEDHLSKGEFTTAYFYLPVVSWFLFRRRSESYRRGEAYRIRIDFPGDP